MTRTTLSRRHFIKTSVLAAGGLSVAIPLLDPRHFTAEAATHELATAYIRISSQGPVVLVMPKVEMGQGIYTGLSMLLAEELELRLDQIAIEAAPPLPAIYGVDNDQSTGGSTSTKDCWHRLRLAGASVREWLLITAAHHWGVPPDQCRAQEGVIRHVHTLRSLTYQEIAPLTAGRAMPRHVNLKPRSQFKLIGRSQSRLDSPAKVDGSACFGIDVRRPDQVYAALAIAPTLGGQVRSLNESAALAIKGVIRIVNEGDVVAAIASNTFAARQALQALEIVWSPGAFAHINQDALVASMKKALNTQKGAAAVSGKPAHGVRTHRAEYFQPFLAHATMEPMNATVHVQGERVEIWTGTQAPDRLVDHVAKLGFKPHHIQLHNHLMGGGFGRRLDVDGVEYAVRIARHLNVPVQVIYSREEDIRHDRYRPCYVDQLEAELDATGAPVRWTHKIAGGSASLAWDGKPLPKGVDSDVVEGAANLPYDFKNIDVRYVQVEPQAIPVSWWRGVGPTRSVLVVESFIDELADLAKADPIEYRLRWLKPERARRVLEVVKALSNWNQALGPGYGRGVSLHSEFGSFMAQVVEVFVADKAIQVKKVYSVMDCGLAVNPDQVRAQIEGGSIFGLTAALYGQITLRNGSVEQSNFHDYPLMRLSETPSFETHLIDSNESPGGVGETATACIQAALLNAIFNASAQRIRHLPVRLEEA